MAKDYKLEVVKEDHWRLPRVRITHEIQEHWVNTFADMAEGYVLDEMGQWREDNECGYRTSYNEFKFRNESQMALFILRWS